MKYYLTKIRDAMQHYETLAILFKDTEGNFNLLKMFSKYYINKMSSVNSEISHICIIHLKISIFMHNTTHLKVTWLKNLMVSYSYLVIILAMLNSLSYSKGKNIS